MKCPRSVFLKINPNFKLPFADLYPINRKIRGDW